MDQKAASDLAKQVHADTPASVAVTQSKNSIDQDVIRATEGAFYAEISDAGLKPWMEARIKDNEAPVK